MDIKKLDVFTASANWNNWFKNACKNSFNAMESITTFMGDFTIADFNHDPKAVQETFGRIKKEWLGNYKYWTEVIAVCNHKCWLWYGEGEFEEPDYYWADEQGYLKHPVNQEMYELYQKLYYQALDLFDATYAEDSEAQSYCFHFTD